MITAVVKGAVQLKFAGDGMTRSMHGFEREVVADNEDALTGSKGGAHRKGELHPGSKA